MNSSATTLRAAVRRWKSAALALFAGTSLLPAQSGQDKYAPTLPPGCEALRAPAGNLVSAHVFAQGFQVYQWNAAGNRWAFVAPAALLFADAGFQQPFGVHFAGPTWVSNSGSRVVGSVAASVTVDPTAIPWLLLKTVTSEGPGPFEATTFIQRVNTTGGRAPARAGNNGETVWIPYTAEYYFYRTIG